MTKQRVLFLCTGNACRSQIAEAWARHLHTDRLEARSAGTAPHGLDPRAVRVMEEADVDMIGHRSKHVDEVRDEPVDWVVTLCDAARESCPVFPAATRTLHRSFEDPPVLAAGSQTEEEALDHYRRVRDEIRAFVQSLPDTLAGG